jgi:hypothetical protein
VDEVLAFPLHTHHGHIELLAAFAGDERKSDDRFRRLQAGDREFISESDEIEQPFVEQMGDTFAHALFGKDDVAGAYPFQNTRMLVIGRLGPDIGQPEIGKGEHGQHAGFDIGPDRNNRSFETGDTQAIESGLVGAVRFHRLG